MKLQNEAQQGFDNNASTTVTTTTSTTDRSIAQILGPSTNQYFPDPPKITKIHDTIAFSIFGHVLQKNRDSKTNIR